MDILKKNKLFFTYLAVGIFLFFGSYQDRIKRSQFIGRTIYLPLTWAVNEFRVIKKLKEENKVQQLLIGEQLLKIISQETKLNKINNSTINFDIADTTYVFADVVGYSGDFMGRTIVVSKGLTSGVKKDAPVFSSNGIVGKVIVPYQNFSVVLPINHSNFKLAVLNKNSGVQGILVTDVFANIAMEYMRFGSNITVGDTIVTSNLSQIFPPNFPIGTVIRLEESSDALYFRAIIQPFNDIGNLQHVYILNKTDIFLHKEDELEILNYEV